MGAATRTGQCPARSQHPRLTCRCRLCPLSPNLTEACFKRTPLDFVGQSMLRWGGRGGKRTYYNATTVSQGTDPPGSIAFRGRLFHRPRGRNVRSTNHTPIAGPPNHPPPGSMWRRNPIPRAWKDEHGEWGQGSNQFQTGCDTRQHMNCLRVHALVFERVTPAPALVAATGSSHTASTKDKIGCVWHPHTDHPHTHIHTHTRTLSLRPQVGNQYSCTGEWGPYNLEIVDQVRVPASLPAGPYVLGFRWDCEESVRGWWRWMPG